MITSIFSKSKPVNSIIVVALITLVFLIENFNRISQDLTSVANGVVRLLILSFYVFLLDFVIAKNKLTRGNSYAVMTFGLLIFMFPKATSHAHLLFANLFILLALRRLISLHSNLHIKKKLFDAGFWIALATVFYTWAFLFFALVLVALIYYSQNNLKNVFVPLIGAGTLMALLVVYNILVHDVYFTEENFQRFASLDFTAYNSKAGILKLTTLATSYIWIFIYYFNIIKDKNKKLKPSYFLLAWSSLLAVLIAVIALLKDGSEFIFLFAPFSIMMANYLESVSEKWFREIFPVMYVLVPIVCLAL